MTRLKELYEKSIVPELTQKFNYKNSMEVPKVKKISLNMGVNSAKKDAKSLEVAKKSLALITGQRPVVTQAKRSIAGFSLRKGMRIGCMVTLRGERMYEFLDRLLNLTIPRIRDFQGVSSNGFDGRGNFTLGLREQFIFPEVEYEDVDRVQGLSVTIVTTAKKDEEAKELLASLGVPFAGSLKPLKDEEDG